MNGSVSWPMRKWAFTKALQVLAFSNVKGKDLTLILLYTHPACSPQRATTRRTAVRNLECAGVSRSDAMKMIGHKTESIYRRYAIFDDRSMKEEAAILDQFHTLDQQPAETTK